jgi:glycerophosphoryl diester phosphodiesterase
VISSKLPQFLIFGHRGSPKRFPENTIASFEETLRAGADGFETDLRLLSDRVPVLFHDHDIIESQSSEQCLDLTRVSELARFVGRAAMILEVKRCGWEEVLVEVVRDWPNIVLASFDHALLAAVRKHNADVPLGITIYGSIVNVAAYAASLGATWCFPDYHYVDGDMVASLRERGIRTVPWAPNLVADWERLRAIGCDGVITDYPAEAVAWRGNS